jgi:hypothetical protein
VLIATGSGFKERTDSPVESRTVALEELSSIE